jgi:cytidylate kinase
MSIQREIIIALDGHSACGKSTLAKDLANKLEYTYIDSGAMYRALTLFLLSRKIDFQSNKITKSLLSESGLEIKRNPESDNIIFLEGKDVTKEIRSSIVVQNVSEVSAIPVIREFLVIIQKKYGKEGGVVMDGRDIGTVIFPKAELKIFLTASTKVRVERRYQQNMLNGISVSKKEIEKNLIKRDHIDSTREISPLKCAEDAVIIDNSQITRTEQLAMIYALAMERIRN